MKLPALRRNITGKNHLSIFVILEVKLDKLADQQVIGNR